MPAYVQSACNPPGQYQNVSIAISPTAGNTLVIGLQIGNSTTDTATVTTSGGSATFTALATINNSYGGRQVLVAYNVAAGITAVNVSTPGFDQLWATVAEFSGVTSLDVSSSSIDFDTSYNTSPTTQSVTTTNANDLVIAFLNGNNSQTMAAPTSGFTLVPNANGAYLSYLIVSSIGTYSTAATMSSQDYWYTFIFALKGGSSGGTAYTQTLTETVSLGSTIARLTGKKASDTFSITSTLTKKPSPVKSESFSLGDLTVKRSAAKNVGDSVAVTDVAAKQTGRSWAETIGIAELYSSTKTKILALLESFSPAEILSRSTQKVVIESLGLADLVSRAAARAITDSISLAETVTRATGRAFADVANSVTDLVARSAQKVIADSVGLADLVSRAAAKAIAEAFSLVDAILTSRAGALIVAFVETLSIADLLARSPRKLISDSVSLVETVARATGRAFVDVANSLTDLVWRSAQKVVADSVGLADAVSRAAAKVIGEVFSLVDALARVLTRVLVLAETLHLVDAGVSWLNSVIDAADVVRVYVVRALQRLWNLVASRRAWTVRALRREWTVGTAMTIHTDPKKAAATEDFKLDWSNAIAADSIQSSTWAVTPIGLTLIAQSNTTTSATVRLAGGSAGLTYTVTNTITLASGQVKVQDLAVPID